MIVRVYILNFEADDHTLSGHGLLNTLDFNRIDMFDRPELNPLLG